jgi:hypothetical protein
MGDFSLSYNYPECTLSREHVVNETFFFKSWLLTVDSGLVWMLIRGYINQLCGETPTDLRMEVPAPTINFASLSVTLIETQRLSCD